MQYEQIEALSTYLIGAVLMGLFLIFMIAGLSEALAQKRHQRAIERSEYDL